MKIKFTESFKEKAEDIAIGRKEVVPFDLEAVMEVKDIFEKETGNGLVAVTSNGGIIIIDREHYEIVEK